MVYDVPSIEEQTDRSIFLSSVLRAARFAVKRGTVNPSVGTRSTIYYIHVFIYEWTTLYREHWKDENTNNDERWAIMSHVHQSEAHKRLLIHHNHLSTSTCTGISTPKYSSRFCKLKLKLKLKRWSLRCCCFAVLAIIWSSFIISSQLSIMPMHPELFESIMLDNRFQELAHPQRRCSLNFYGLPRAFKRLVLPSIIANVIIPNIHYDCDYFVQFFNVTFEPPSRSGRGGFIETEDVYLLRDAVHTAAIQAGRPPPHVGFVVDTLEEFEQRHSSLVEKIRRNETGEKNPFHGKEKSFTVETYVNIIKMWHSISTAWESMTTHAALHNIKYERVTMLRNDVVYLKPIDVFRSAPGGAFDTFNNHSMVPSFASWPVNDRMFCGPYEATKIWATGRFSRLDDYVYGRFRGRGLNSEQFLGAVIMPDIRNLGIPVVVNRDICFLRARPDGSVWKDCGGSQQSKERLEKLVNLTCPMKHYARTSKETFVCPISSM